MKKSIVLLVFILGCSLLTSQEVSAQSILYRIPLSCHWGDNSGVAGTMPRGPIDPPTVYLEDYTLTFEVDHPEYVLYIKDEDEVVVYSTVVTSAETEVTLPSYLSGTYEIELVMGNWLFTGWIDL